MNAEATCMRCHSAEHLTYSIAYVEPGAYAVEPVFICANCRPQHERDVSMTTRFRQPCP